MLKCLTNQEAGMNKLSILLIVGALAFWGHAQYLHTTDSREIERLQQDLYRMEQHAQTLEQQLFHLEKQYAEQQSDNPSATSKSKELIKKWSGIAEQFAEDIDDLGERLKKEWEGNQKQTEPKPISSPAI